MSTENIKSVFQYLQNNFSIEKNAEESLKIYVIYLFIFLGFIVLFGLGLKGLYTSQTPLTIFLLGGSLVLLLNFFYLKKTKNDVFSGYIILYLFFSLLVYLIYSGGVDNTGPLWIYCLPPLALSVHGLSRGVLNLILFLILISFILFYPHPSLLDTTYTFAYKIRIVLSFIVVIILSSVYEYFHELSSARMKTLKKDLEFFLRSDELTGLYNRRGYQDKVTGNKNAFSAILMCDIDHFKNVNDTYGHHAGDYVIQEVAKCIKNTLRRDDIAVRWGGEEFLIFLSVTTLNNAYLVSEKIRETIESSTFSYSDEIKINITVSIGISKLNENISLENAIMNADNAMYVSKADGRNKTSSY